jgi:hypothetical protein
MAEYTGEVIYDTPQVKPKPVVNPALVNALVPPAPVASAPGMALSPQDQRTFALSEANKRTAEQVKIREEARQKATKLEEEQRAIKAKSEEIDLKKLPPISLEVT